MSAPQALSVTETPTQIAAGGVVEIQTLFVHNPGASGAYVKLYASAAAPNGSAVPIFSAWIPATSDRVLPVFAGAGQLWIAAAAEALAGLTAPASPFAVSITSQR